MLDKSRVNCPTCLGEKVIPGICEVSSEWRGSNADDALDDSVCTPDQKCPTCDGKGYSHKQVSSET